MQYKNQNTPKEQRKKIAILLPNPCNPDYRIIKYAELFKSDGHEVAVFCRSAPSLPTVENLNGVIYFRKPIIAVKTLGNLAKNSILPQTQNLSLERISTRRTHTQTHTHEEIQSVLIRIIRKITSHTKKRLSKLSLPFKKVATYFNHKVAYKSQPAIFQAVFMKDVIEWGPDIVQCHDWQTLQLGSEIKKACGSRLVFDSHELETHRNPPLSPARKRWMEKYEARLLPQCDLVTTVCESIACHLENAYKIKRPWVIVNSPIVDKHLTPSPVPRWGRMPGTVCIRSDAQFPQSAYLLTVVGNLTINRGIETLLEAMRILPNDITLAMVGKAAPEFKAQINRLISEYSLDQRVRLLEPVNPVFLVEFLKSANLGIIPIIPKTLSYQYALPNKLFECAFAGLPILASDTVEMKKIIERYSLGSTFPYGNHKKLAEDIMIHRQNWSSTNGIQKNSENFIEDSRFEKSTTALRNWVYQP